MAPRYRQPDDPEEMAARIRAARGWAGMTQKEVGLGIGKDASTVERMEKGDEGALGRTPQKRARVRLEIARATGVWVGFFLQSWGVDPDWKESWDQRREDILGASHSESGRRLAEHIRYEERNKRLFELEVELGLTRSEVLGEVLNEREREVVTLTLEARQPGVIADRLGMTVDEVKEILTQCEVKLAEIAKSNASVLDPDAAAARPSIAAETLQQLEEIEGRPLDQVEDHDLLTGLEDIARASLEARGAEITWQTIAQEIVAVAIRQSKEAKDAKKPPDP